MTLRRARRARRRTRPSGRPRIGDDRRPRVRPRPGARLRRRDRAGCCADGRRSGSRASRSASAQTIALNDVSFDVTDGEFFAMLGPPGAGKTTTLRTIVGLETPDEGDVYIDDERVNDVWPGDRDISIVFQNLALYPDKTVFDNLAFPLKQHKRAEEGDHARASSRRRGRCTSSTCSTASRASCRAASASASRSGARSCAIRAPICSTSRSRRSTRCCGSRCAPS